MNTPPGLLGAALLFWGWQTGLVLFAALMALLLEGSRAVAWRWDLSRSDFNRVSDLCTLAFLGMAVYVFATSAATPAVIGILQWNPLTLFPLVAAQAYSVAGKVDVGALFLLRRGKGAEERGRPRRTIDLSYAYGALCILSASAANSRSPWFYVGMCLLSAWGLWSGRSRTCSPLVWGSLVLVIGGMGYGGHLALHQLQQALEDAIAADSDPSRNDTAIGQIGALKLSDRIVLRVEPTADARASLLLREASYNIYNASAWFAIDSGFSAVPPEADGTTWTLQGWTGLSKRIRVAVPLKRGKGMLAMPTGTLRIEGLPVLEMKRNRLGAVKVAEGPGLITYTAWFRPSGSPAGPPHEADVKVPKSEAPVISRIAAELGLASHSPREALRTVAAFFQQNFRYSTFLGARKPPLAPLEDFFLRSRSGHCEYFATATVLLLRAAGIPARYATGYSVQEFSRFENMYIVRARHAHAWAQAYIDGIWQDFDTTPAVWVTIEQQAASWWEPLSDLWSWGAFRFQQWRWSAREGGVTPHLGWLLVPLIAILVWKLRARKRVARVGTEHTPVQLVRTFPGEDSAFYLIEERLTELGYVRYPWEPLARWMQRIEAMPQGLVSTDSLHALVSLHYRYRFDPRGISAAEHEALTSNVQAWLAHHQTRTGGHPHA
ncbi:MAG: transglutaminase domain-containing protein [Nitrospinae bacterium]|nr:transglutaminase domain-containing protein [Nitrospinota bacterium]